MEAELVHKLSCHFEYNLKTAIITQGVQTLEALLNLLAQWEDDIINQDSIYT